MVPLPKGHLLQFIIVFLPHDSKRSFLPWLPPWCVNESSCLETDATAGLAGSLEEARVEQLSGISMKPVMGKQT